MVCLLIHGDYGTTHMGLIVGVHMYYFSRLGNTKRKRPKCNMNLTVIIVFGEILPTFYSQSSNDWFVTK
jgi:hypothetical protein